MQNLQQCRVEIIRPNIYNSEKSKPKGGLCRFHASLKLHTKSRIRLHKISKPLIQKPEINYSTMEKFCQDVNEGMQSLEKDVNLNEMLKEASILKMAVNHLL